MIDSGDLRQWPRLLDHAFGYVSSFRAEGPFVVEGYVHDVGHALLHSADLRFPLPLRLDVKAALYDQTYREAIHEEVLVIAAERWLLATLKEPYFAYDSEIIYALRDSLVGKHGKAPSVSELERRIEAKMRTKRAAALARRIDKVIRAAVTWAVLDLDRNKVKESTGGFDGKRSHDEQDGRGAV